MRIVQRLTAWAQALKRDVLTVYFAARDAQAPLGLRVLAGVVAAYALSPVDLIPDFIPVLGYLDDLLIVPLGLWLVLRWMPEAVRVRARLNAQAVLDKPRSLLAAALFVGLWALLVFSLVVHGLGAL